MTLVISEKDMEVFNQLAKQKDIKKLQQHCEKVFPLWFHAMKKTAINQLIEQAIIQAQDNMLTLPDNIRLYLDAMIILGSYFQQDLQFLVLQSPYQQKDIDELGRSLQFYTNLNDYIKQVLGDEDQYQKEMFYRLTITELPVFTEENFITEIQALFKQIYPQKIAFVSQIPYTTFIQLGKSRALNQYHFQHMNQQAIYLLLQFLLGQYFDKDIACSWLNWPEIVQQIQNNRFSLKTLAKTLTKTIIVGA